MRYREQQDRCKAGQDRPQRAGMESADAPTCAASATVLPPVESYYAQTEGGRVHVLAAGAGSPLLLVHGLLGAASCWSPVMRLLARHARVYAVDSLGIGLSERVSGLDASLEATARRLAAWMDREELPAVDLVGTSHGGAVAMYFAALYPERVRSLILQAPANPFCVQSQPQIRFAKTLAGRLLAQILPWAPQPVLSVALARMYANPALVRSGSLREYVAGLRVPGTVDHVLAILAAWNPDMRALLPLLPKLCHLPTLLLWGAHDRAVSLASAERLRDLLHAPLEILDNLGHLPFEEAPDRFAQVVLRFLKTLEHDTHATALLHA